MKPSTPMLLEFFKTQAATLRFLALANIMASCIPMMATQIEAERGRNQTQVTAYLTELFQGADPLATLENLTRSFSEDSLLFRRLWMELALQRAVNNFHCYLADLLLSVLLARPRILSPSQVLMADVLEAGSVEEFAADVAARKISSLSYGGFAAMKDYIVKTLKIPLDLEDSLQRQAVEAINVRNAIVHNRGRADSHFIRQASRTDLATGDLVPINKNLLSGWLRGLETAAESIDRAFVEKYGIDLFLHSEPRDS